MYNFTDGSICSTTYNSLGVKELDEELIVTLQVNSLNRGSCEGCEAACGVVFRPVCSRDQDTVYPNQCQAACAGAADTVECQVHCRN